MGIRYNFFRNFVLGTQKALGNTWLLRIFERRLLRDAQDDLLAPMFIIGAPRTGSTLLYQLLIRNFKLSYFNNMQSFFYGSPALIGKLTQKFDLEKCLRQIPESNFGYIPGAYSPSESGAIFRFWFGDNDLSGIVSESRQQLIRKTLGYLSSTISAPFIAKNLNNALRLGTISAVFPESVFLWIKRDPLYASQSLIKMRRKLYGSDEVWASIKPPGYASISQRLPFEQVVHQIKEINDGISRHFEKEDFARCIKINYEELCEKPYKILESIAKSYEHLSNHRLQETPGAETITLSTRNTKQLSDSEWKRLNDIINRINADSN